MKALYAMTMVSLALCGCAASQNQPATSSPTVASEQPVSVPPTAPALNWEKTRLTATQEKAVKDAVTTQLKDPYSAQFGRLAAAKAEGGEFIPVCGKVNAKNSFGGYTGDTSFYVLADPLRENVANLMMFGSTKLDDLTIFSRCKGFGLTYY